MREPVRASPGQARTNVRDAGRAFELTPKREIVWEWRSPFRAPSDETLVATLFDVVRLAPDFALDWLESGR